ncbi:hypothetical protein LPUS_10587 [Lasallia pustulata]|uniref:RRM domain-containing protein n=1 Tax=Lasallia pustulata TaxID=136370 RepID=A0A1W5D9W5_9LECA|nr:hypothetical protein LPUS_10587 [Lasallia pustulata]
MAARKGPVNVDDQENIKRFLEQAMRRHYEAAFTPSRPSNTSTTSSNTVPSASPSISQRASTTPQHTATEGQDLSEATTSTLDIFSPKVNKPQEQLAMLPPPASTTPSPTPVSNQPPATPAINVNKTMQRSRGVSLNAGSDDALTPHQLPQWMEENSPPSHHSPTRTARPQTLVDKFLQSPQMSGLQAPPPTPESGPVFQPEITNIIHNAFDELHNSHPPALTLGDSKYAPRRKSLLGQTRSDIQHSFDGEGYTRFITPNRELSSDGRRKRDEGFDDMNSQLNSSQGKFITTASATAGGDGKDKDESLQLRSSTNARPPPHLRPSNPSASVNEDGNKNDPSPNKLMSPSAPGIAEGPPPADLSQTAYRFGSSSEHDQVQQIGKLQALNVGHESTRAAKLTSPEGTAISLRLNTSAKINSTGGDWVPPHLRLPEKGPLLNPEPLDRRSYQLEGARSIVQNHGEASSHQSQKREDRFLLAKTIKTSEPVSHNHENLPQLHSRKPAIVFTGQMHNVVPGLEAPGTSSLNSDGYNPWQPGQPKSGFLAAPLTPTEQATYTPADSSAGSRTPPHLRPREKFDGSSPRLSSDNPHVESAHSDKASKHAGPLSSNPFTTTAATASSVITRGASRVPPTVAAVDSSLSALAAQFTPTSSTKLPMSINTAYPLPAQENLFSRTISTPQSAVETGVITPSSMIFSAVSPATAAAAGILAAMREANERPNLEDVLFFKSWPKSDDERRPAARIRKVIITNLPPQSTANFVQSLVFGGPIEQINMAATSASVVFVDADDTKKYYDATANGLVYKKEGDKEHFVFVELAKDVDVVGGLLQEMIDKSVTRCVKAVGVDEDWGMPALWKMAERKGRKVENILGGVNDGGVRTVTFRFCNMLDARAFIGVLQRDEEWEHCNIVFAADPCEQATGVHFD